jgi:hypothetical protein
MLPNSNCGLALLGGRATIDNLEITEELKGSSIFTLRGAFTVQDCDEILTLFTSNTDKAAPGSTSSGRIDSLKTTLDLLVVPSYGVDFKEIDAKIYSGFKQCFGALTKIIPGSFTSNVRDTGYIIGKYEANKGFYSWHYDNGLGVLLAGILYLNDVPEGGETSFWYSGLKIKPEKGKVLIFPMGISYLHCGEVSSVDKYIVTTFLIENNGT